MGKWKPAFDVMRALVPVLYWGGLLYYFLDVGGSLHNAIDIGLGPTLLGLAIVGLLFCIPLSMKVVRLFATPQTPGSGGDRGGPNRPTDDDDGGAAAEAAIARYMARRSADVAQAAPAGRRPQGGPPAKGRSFGRKSGRR